MNKPSASFFIVVHPPKPPVPLALAHSSPMGIRHIESKMAPRTAGAEVLKYGNDPGMTSGPPRTSEVARQPDHFAETA
jgi:hypothetical protein